MKIFCVVNNYGDVACGEPEWYTLPDSTILRSDNPFFIPEFDSQFVAIPSIAVRINRLGKSVAPKFAHRYYSEAAMVCCVVAQNLLQELAATCRPWSRAVAFDRSCLVGDFIDKETLFNTCPIDVKCGSLEVRYEMNDIKHSIDEVVAMVSRDNTLKTGDMVLAAMMPVSLPLAIGDTLDVTIPSKKLLTIRIR